MCIWNDRWRDSFKTERILKLFENFFGNYVEVQFLMERV